MGRAPCCDKNGLKKGPWTPEEDQKLTDYIQKNGYGNWRTLPKNAGLQRCGKSCRLRWTNYLRPDIKRGRFSFEEEETIIQLHSILGNKWSAIAGRLPGRTDNEIKNYWNTHIRKRLLRMGIDPVTHSPRLDLLDLSSILNASLGTINPDLIRLATSLLSSDHRRNYNHLINPHLPTSQDGHQLMQYNLQPSQNQCWDASLPPAAALPNYGYYGSDHSETSTTFQSNSSSNNFSFQHSVASSPNYNHINGAATAEDEREISYCSTDDMLRFDEIPADILDNVADFL